MTTTKLTGPTIGKRSPGRPPIENPLKARVVVRFRADDDSVLDIAAMHVMPLDRLWLPAGR